MKYKFEVVYDDVKDKYEVFLPFDTNNNYAQKNCNLVRDKICLLLAELDTWVPIKNKRYNIEDCKWINEDSDTPVDHIIIGSGDLKKE